MKGKLLFKTTVVILIMFLVDFTIAGSCLEGDWYFRSLSTQKNGQPDNFGYDTGILNFQSDGALSGTLTSHDDANSFSVHGNTVLLEDGSIYMLLDGPLAVNLVVNESGSLMASNDEGPDAVYFNVYARKGNSYSISDLQGTWYLRNLQISKDDGQDDFGYDSATITIQEDGNLIGTVTDETGYSWQTSGIASIDPNGIVIIDLNDWIGDPWINVMNAQKNTIIGNCQDGSSLFLNIFLKKGNSYTLSDLTGTWLYRSLGTQMNGQPDNFGYDNSVITINADGSFLLVETGTTSDETGGILKHFTGTASIDSNGVVSLNFPSESLVFNPVLNAEKDVMVNNYIDPGDETGLEIFLKKESIRGDLNRDGRVDFLDFADFAENWLWQASWY